MTAWWGQVDSQGSWLRVTLGRVLTQCVGKPGLNVQRPKGKPTSPGPGDIASSHLSSLQACT